MKGIGIIVGAALALGLTLATRADAQSAQEFWIEEARKAERKPARAGRLAPAPVAESTLSLGLGVLGGSWLASNLGASRPQGAPGAWCGYAMRLEVISMGRPDPGPAFNAVSHWRTYGSLAPRGAIGSIFVSVGHVSKVVAHDCGAGAVRTISGNATARRVAHMCEPLSSLVVSRWP